MDNTNPIMTNEKIEALYEHTEELKSRLKKDIDNMSTDQLIKLYKLKSCLMGGRHE